MVTTNTARFTIKLLYLDRTIYLFLKIFKLYINYFSYQNSSRGRDSSVGIATRYGLDGPGIKSRCGGEIFSTPPDRPWGPPSLLYNGYRVFHGDLVAGAWC